jgi:ubiquinone/menaquinone biosynthesis C-methylase UbiE
MDPIESRIADLNGGRILDVATGHGDFLKILTESFADYDEAVGIDTAEDRLASARKKGLERTSFLEMSAEQIDYPDNHFDTVAIRHSLHHLENPEQVLHECVRVLKPGGLFIVGEVYQSPETEQPNSQRHLHHWWAAVDRTQGKSHNETFTTAEIRAFVERLKLRIEEVFEYDDTCDEAESAEALEQMLAHTRNLLKELKAADGPEDLIAQGEHLVELFEREGLTDDPAIYVLSRK